MFLRRRQSTTAFRPSSSMYFWFNFLLCIQYIRFLSEFTLLYTTWPAGGSKPWSFTSEIKYCLWPIFSASPAAVWMSLPAACHWAGPHFWKPLTRTRECLWGLPSPRPSSLPPIWPSPSSHPGSGRHFHFKIMLTQPFLFSNIIPYETKAGLHPQRQHSALGSKRKKNWARKLAQFNAIKESSCNKSHRFQLFSFAIQMSEISDNDKT